jgi:hypothetical protein
LKRRISFKNRYLETLMTKENTAGEADDTASDDANVEVRLEFRGRAHGFTIDNKVSGL